LSFDSHAKKYKKLFNQVLKRRDKKMRQSDKLLQMVSEFLLKLLAETAKETFSVTCALIGWAPKSNT
jgi:hypothetical protein